MMTPATRRLLAETSQLEMFNGSFEEVREMSLDRTEAEGDVSLSNPFEDDCTVDDTAQEKDIPLLKATRDILSEEKMKTAVPEMVAAAVREANEVQAYPDIGFDRVLMERALDACDWTRLKVAADRIIRTSRQHNSGSIPSDIIHLQTALEATSRHATSLDDRRGFEFALAHADWNMARLLGTQILDFIQESPSDSSSDTSSTSSRSTTTSTPGIKCTKKKHQASELPVRSVFL